MSSLIKNLGLHTHKTTILSMINILTTESSQNRLELILLNRNKHLLTLKLRINILPIRIR